MEDRYDRQHTYNKVTFYLADYLPNEEECCYLLMKMIEQTVRDYCSLHSSTLQQEKDTWESARGFIFDDEYRVAWGETALSLESVLDILDIDIHWFREQTTKKFGEIKK